MCRQRFQLEKTTEKWNRVLIILISLKVRSKMGLFLDSDFS